MAELPPRTARWDRFASDWHLVGLPLRPAPYDLAVYERAAEAWRQASGRPARALLLGVTPEIATMRWPAGTLLAALDRSAGMLELVWPAPAHGVAARANWLAPPLADGSIDIVIGDNPFTRHRYPEGHRALLDVIRRLLAPGGRLLMRYFCGPAAPEPPSRVLEDLHAGRIGSFHAFKWRLAMSLQRSLAEGVAWGEVWNAWRREVPDPEALMRERGWPLEQLRTIDVNRGSADRMSFPVFDECARVLRETFVLEETVVPPYELGERCPIVVARAR